MAKLMLREDYQTVLRLMEEANVAGRLGNARYDAPQQLARRFRIKEDVFDAKTLSSKEVDIE